MALIWALLFTSQFTVIINFLCLLLLSRSYSVLTGCWEGYLEQHSNNKREKGKKGERGKGGKRVKGGEKALI